MIHDLEELSRVVLGRPCDLFSGEDFTPCRTYKRALFIGGAGFIGQATIDAFLTHGALEHLSVVDPNENTLVEVIRNVSCRAPDLALDAQAIAAGTDDFTRFMAGQPPYDIVLIFSALKHVRSERGQCCVRMYDTNVRVTLSACATVSAHSPGCRIFYCSTDKAADPTTIMGATKWWGENIALSFPNATCARFANVAFSSGSLLEGFLHRIAKRQPLSAPSGINRWMVSPAEAGRFCLLAATWPRAGSLLVPLGLPLTDFPTIAARLLHHFDRWMPVQTTPPVLSCEKEVEKFVGVDDLPQPCAGRQVMEVYKPMGAPLFCRSLPVPTSPSQVEDAIRRAMPRFRRPTPVPSSPLAVSDPSPATTPPA